MSAGDRPMIRDTVQRVTLAFAIPCLVLAVVRGGLSVAFGWDAPEAGWVGTVAGLLLVAEMVYGWLRKRDNARRAQPISCVSMGPVTADQMVAEITQTAKRAQAARGARL